MAGDVVSARLRAQPSPESQLHPAGGLLDPQAFTFSKFLEAKRNQLFPPFLDVLLC